MARIVTVYEDNCRDLNPVDMSYIRWLKISEALAKRGNQVDIAANENGWIGENLRRVPLRRVNWNTYDVVKTLFHKGFVTLEKYGGTDHPFVVSKLGSVVDSEDSDGIYFYGEERERLFDIQKRIAQKSRYVVLLSEICEKLWHKNFADAGKILIVPGAAEENIPKPGISPYKPDTITCLFAGNVYGNGYQPEANKVLIGKLNELGKYLTALGGRLHMIGNGDVARVDKKFIMHYGAIPYRKSWDFLHYATVGVIVSAGITNAQHVNESTKIYHYLRAGLPVVCEKGFPNEYVIKESRGGFLVENNNMQQMATKVMEAANKTWDKEYMSHYILQNHTWDKRAELYDTVIQ